MTRIVVGIDSSTEARAAVLQAAGMAADMDAELHVVAGYVRVRASQREREGAPSDVTHGVNTRGALDALLADAEQLVAGRGVAVRTWSGAETPSRMMRRVAREIGAEFVLCGPELSRVNERRRLWNRRPRHTLAERVAQRSTWKVLDLTAPATAGARAPVAPATAPLVREPEPATVNG